MTQAHELPPRREWVEDQMERADVPKDFQTMISRLLEIMWFYEMNDGLDTLTSAKIVTTFSELAKGHSLVPDRPDEVWIQAKSGQLVVRDRVRVRKDGYLGPAATVHNGREGDIVAIRSGDIHVRYLDDEELHIVRHKPEVLEKRVH